MKRLLQTIILSYSICLLAFSASAEGNFKSLLSTDLALNVTIDVGDATCAGSSNGVLNAVPDGGLPPYTYLWSNGATTQIVTGVPVGNYSVTVTDALGATATANATVGESDPINVVLAATYESSPGCSDGKIDVIKSQLGNSGPYTYIWSTGSTHWQLLDVPAGIYCVTVTNAFGCTGDGCIELELLPDSLMTAATATDATCGADNGTATATASGGIPPYSYQWNDAAMQTTATATNLAPGTYTVTISDQGACPQEQTVTVVSDTPIDIQSTVVGEICMGGDGSITLNVTGGTSPYTYAWSDAGIGNTNTATGLSAGSFSVTVTDTNGCSAVEDPIVVTNDCPNPPCTDPVVTSVIVFEETCGNADGRAIINVAGGPYNYAWTPNVSSTNTANNLAAGTYTVVITNISDPTCNTTETFTLGVIDGPIVTLVATTPATCRESNGTAVLSPIGLTYEWCNGYVGNNPIDLPAGECQVTVTDPSTGCVDVIEVVIDEFVPLTATPTINQQPDCNSNNGSVTIAVGGGSFNYSYTWSDGGTGETRTDLAPGSYCVTVTDNGPTGCESTACFVLIANTGNVVVSATSPVVLTCPGSADGTVLYTVVPDDPANTVVILDANGTVATNGALIPGDYCIVVSDATGCAIGGDCFEVTSPGQIDVDVDIIDKDCGMNGAINLVDVSGGNGGFSFAWIGPGFFSANTQNISDLEEGTYSVTITDAKGCIVIVDGIAIEDICICAPPVVGSVVVIEADCGSSDGKATINIVGNIADYNFFWTPSVSNDNKALNIPAGIYSVRIEDKTDATCFTTETFTVGADGGFDDVQKTQGDASCNAADGTVTFTPNTYEYLWNDGVMSASRSDLAAGAYFVAISNPADPTCIDYRTVIVTENNPLVINVIIDQRPDCNASNGMVTLNVIGGSNDYSYSWTGNAASQNNLAAGIYTVLVMDNVSGCQKEITFALTDDVPSATLTIAAEVSTSCTGINDASVDLNTLVTDPGFVGPAVITIEDQQGNVYQSGDLPPGNYCALIRDANGCLAGSNCFSVRYPDQIDIDIAINDKDCIGAGSIEIVEVIGGTGIYTFDWLDINPSTNDPKDRDNLDAGVYTLVCIDENGCEVSEAITVEDNSAIISATPNAVMVSCDANMDGSISITPAGGTAPYTYEWSGTLPSTASVDNLPVGQYSVTVTDAAGCSTVVGPIDLTADNSLAVQTTTTINISCTGNDDGSIAVVATGGTAPYTYDWGGSLPNTDSLSNLSEGQYTVTITDAKGCTVVAGPIALDADNSLAVLSITPNNISCAGNNDGSITVVATGGTAPYSYDWGGSLPNSDVQINLSEGQYSVTITDARGCTTVAGPVDLDADNSLDIQLSGDTIACSGSLVDINVIVNSGNPATINWTDATGTVVINNGAPTLQVTASGSNEYYVEVISGGCTAYDTVAVEEFIFSPTVDLTASACMGEGVTLNPNGDTNLNYVWSPSGELVDATVASPEILQTSQSGVFTVIISDPAKPECTIEEMVSLTVNDVPSLGVTGDTIACSADEIEYTASSDIGTNFEWSTLPDFSNSTPGQVFNGMPGVPGEEVIYYVRVTDASGECEAIDSVVLNNFAVRVSFEPEAVCLGEEFNVIPLISLSAGEILNFNWHADNATIDISNPEEPIILANETTMVVANVTNNYGCSLADSVLLEVESVGVDAIPVAEPDTILRGESSQLDILGTQMFTYSWFPGETLSRDDIANPVATPMETTTYSVMLETDNGCAEERSVEVVVITQCVENLFFPNAFTPNNDGKNDVLFLRGAFVEDMYFAIYNRWGEKVFESNNINIGWDGTYKGEQLSSDVFGYYLRATCIDGTEHTEQGNVSLLR